jgi:hypothetical protein
MIMLQPPKAFSTLSNFGLEDTLISEIFSDKYFLYLQRGDISVE